MFDIIINDYIMKEVPFTRSDCIQYIYFCAHLCNGTEAIADILRVIRSGIVDLQVLIYDRNNLYDALGYIALESSRSAPGKCSLPRHYFCSNGEMVKDISSITEAILQDIETFNNLYTKKSRHEQYKCDQLLSKFTTYDGCSTVSRQTLFQLCALTGLIPLSCYKYASLKHDKFLKSGAAKIIQQCCHTSKPIVTANEANVIFNKIHDEINRIWNGRMTMSFLENMLYVLHRMLSHSETSKKPTAEGKKLTEQEIEEVLCSQTQDPSSLRDILYLYNHRCRERPLQALFQCNITNSHGKCPELKTCIKRFHEKTGLVTNDIFTITQWKKDKPLTSSGAVSKRVLVCWNNKGEIHIDDDLMKYFISRCECRLNNKCKLCES
jgi:hypothetical protein